MSRSLAVTMFDAGPGDAFAVETTSDSGKRHVIVVDGGPPGTPDNGMTDYLVRAGGTVDLLVVSHVDEDHIGGVLDLASHCLPVRAQPPTLTLDVAWHNSLDALSSGSFLSDGGLLEHDVSARLQAWARTRSSSRDAMAIVASIGQGRSLADYLTILGLSGNPPFDGPVHATRTWTMADGGPYISVTGPSSAELQRFLELWERHVREETDRDRRASLAAQELDRSVTNMSSIVFLVGYPGLLALFTGDARGDKIVEGLREAGLLNNGRLKVAFLKVPHHGSERSCTRDLFDTVLADVYLISGNGKNDNPSPEMAKRLCSSRFPGDKFTVVLSHDIPDVVSVFRAHPGATVSIRRPSNPFIRSAMQSW